jgi:hypothetical protein
MRSKSFGEENDIYSVTILDSSLPGFNLDNIASKVED